MNRDEVISGLLRLCDEWEWHARVLNERAAKTAILSVRAAQINEAAIFDECARRLRRVVERDLAEDDPRAE